MGRTGTVFTSTPTTISLTRALIALGVLLVAINIGAAIWDVRTDLERTEFRARRDISNMARLIAEQTSSSLEAVDLVLRDVARNGGVAKIAPAVKRLKDEIVHVPQVNAFLILDAQGRVIGRTNEPPPIDTGLRDRAYFSEHRDAEHRGLIFSQPYQAITNGNWRFSMSRRLNSPDGRFDGVVIASMEIENFDRLYRTIDIGEGGFIDLLTQDGTVITRVPDRPDTRGRKFPNPETSRAVAREGRFTGWTISPILHERVLVSTFAVRGFPVNVFTGATEDSVLGPWRREAWRVAVRTALTSAAMLVLIALAAWGLARREQALQLERKHADEERARLEQRLRGAEKMEAVGRLAGGIAHDFNNILGGILGYGEMLVDESPAGSRLKRYAQNVLTAANRARDLVDQILAYSRSQRGNRVAVDFLRIVSETLELVRGSLVSGVQLEAHLPPGPLPVIGDPTQLHQVVMNLCTNALHAIDGSGSLVVTLSAIELEAEHVYLHGTLAAGSYVSLSVKDSGPGMDEPTLGRIFEPFFTTKEVGKGTGLGLSLVYGIVTDSGGAIHVTSQPGRGSTFTIYLPRADVAVEADRGEVPPLRGRGERVLLVDDEEALVAVTSEVLTRLGYSPVTFSDSRAALAEFESNPRSFDAVITDEVMPHLAGTDLAALVHRRRADIPVVLVSGYIGPMMSERAAGAGIAEILKKPVQSRELAAALARVLGGANPRVDAPHPGQALHP